MKKVKERQALDRMGFELAHRSKGQNLNDFEPQSTCLLACSAIPSWKSTMACTAHRGCPAKQSNTAATTAFLLDLAGTRPNLATANKGEQKEKGNKSQAQLWAYLVREIKIS